MKSFIYIPEISIYIFINIKISIKRCKNVEFCTKNAREKSINKINPKYKCKNHSTIDNYKTSNDYTNKQNIKGFEDNIIEIIFR